jgi:hypothetical protein
VMLRARSRLAGRLAIGGAACLLAVSPVACGGGDDDGDGDGAESRAAQLCRDYRDAVTEVRFDGSEDQLEADFRAAAAAARAAAEGTSEQDLSVRAEDYLTALERLATAYDDAAEATAARDREGYNAALDVAEPTDDAFNGLAEAEGFESCALAAPAADEGGVSQSGFPAMAVPERAFPGTPPTGGDGVEQVVSYPLDDAELLRLVRGPKLETGTVPLDEAAELFEGEFGEGFSSLEAAGDSGNELVEMRRYDYEQEEEEGSTITGTAHVFSGQGNVWALDCSTDDPAGPSPELEQACERAVATLGFLMF